MKLLVLIGLLFSTHTFAAGVLKTACKQGDCFKYGWVTKGINYSLDNTCKKNNCEKYGWQATDSLNKTFDVQCLAGACFTEGWLSTEKQNDKVLVDTVLCNEASCLEFGWLIHSDYSKFVGSVSCTNEDCRKFGGASFWRDEWSKNVCIQSDCYKNGWYTYIY